MKGQKGHYIYFLLAILFSSPTIALANDNKPSTEIFASNNSSEIDLQTAFHRLHGKEQLALQDVTIGLMQKEHFEQSKFENLLGIYKMSSDNKITADNSEKVILSPLQKLSSEKKFKMAAKLANLLKQESVAVFIPDKESAVADTILKLRSHHYTINETITLIHEKLSAQYNQAFSLHLERSANSNFDTTTIEEVEWLGSKIKSDDIKKIFPNEEITSQQGKAFLVYQSGKKEQL